LPAEPSLALEPVDGIKSLRMDLRRNPHAVFFWASRVSKAIVLLPCAFSLKETYPLFGPAGIGLLLALGKKGGLAGLAMDSSRSLFGCHAEDSNWGYGIGSPRSLFSFHRGQNFFLDDSGGTRINHKAWKLRHSDPGLAILKSRPSGSSGPELFQ